jgi:hypothetical protein
LAAVDRHRLIYAELRDPNVAVMMRNSANPVTSRFLDGDIHARDEQT